MAANDPESILQTQISMQKRASVFLAVFLPLCVAVASLAQERYSADSLMATFEKGSKTSIKGAEITFTDVIVETKKSRLTFKSSRNDKVICELISPISSESVSAGTSLTVVGKVRGRGMLGNVTLDECHLILTPPSVVVSAPASAPNEATTIDAPDEPSKVSSEKPPVAKDAEAVMTNAAKVSPRLPSQSQIELMPEPLPSIANDAEPTQEPEPPVKVIEASKVGTQQVLTSRKFALPNNSYAVGGVFVGLALLAVVILRPALRRRFGVPARPNTPEMRRVALEALLSAENKKK